MGRKGKIRLVRKFARLLRNARPTQQRTRGYLICSTPRSGSTYLAELLSSTRLLGFPREYLNVRGKWGRLDRDDPTNLGRLLERVLETGRTSNGVYALKAHADHFAAIAAVVDPLTVLPNLRFVRIRRRDLLGQAISWCRAEQTQHFRASKRSTVDPVYSTPAIRGFLRLLEQQQAHWDRVLAPMAHAPLEIEYEQLMVDPQGHVNRVAALMGVTRPTPIVASQVTVTVQRDQLSAAWRDRFLADTGDEFRHLVVARRPSRPGSASAS